MLAADATLPLVLCHAGDTLIGLEAWRVAASRATPSHAPDTPGKTLAACCGLPDSSTPPSQWLLLRTETSDAAPCEVGITGSVELRPIPIASIHPLPALLAARSQLPGLRALAWIDGRLVPILAPSPPPLTA